MSIADKLTLLASSKEALRVKLALPKNLPLSEYHKYSYPFDPMMLFAGGKQGVWYDPSDKSTLFQDAAGTKPVTKDGDPVGLRLDKSQGLVLGNELVVTPLSVVKGDGVGVVGSCVVLDPLAAFHGQFSVALSQNLNLSSYYIVQFTISDVVGTGAFSRLGSESGSLFQARYNGTYSFIVKSNSTLPIVRMGNYGAAENSFKMCNLSVKELKGNHATQTVSAARPIYKKDAEKAWLYNDKIDDKLLVKLPAMTATVVKATDEGVSIDYPVNITADEYAITSTSALGHDYGHLIINKELSASEITQVTNYFNAKRGV